METILNLNLNGDQKLIFQAHHWDYLDRHMPQQATMSHALAVDGKNMDFNDPKPVQQWRVIDLNQ
jgi:hypothetical protein